MTETGKIYSDYGGDRLYLRPVINLKSDVKVSGTGTNSDPICGWII